MSERKIITNLKRLLKDGKVDHALYKELTGDAVEPSVVLDPNVEFPALCDWPLLPNPDPVIDQLLLYGCIHVFAGLYESYKTIAALEACAAILQGRKAFDHFEVKRPAEILYLCPDTGPALFFDYASQFNLHKEHGFRVMRHDADLLHAIDSDVLKVAVKDRILVLDTMLDYADIKDGFQSHEWVAFFQKLRHLIRHCGCVAILLIAHPTKAGARNTVIEPTEFLKDSVTFGGKIDVGYAFRKMDQTCKVHVERIKGRGFKRSIRFELTVNDDDGNSWLSRGCFPVCVPPEDCLQLNEKLSASTRGGRPMKPVSWLDEALRLNEQKISLRQIAESLNKKGYAVSHELVRTKIAEAKKKAADQESIPF